MTFPLWRQEMRRQRELSRRAASEMGGDAGAFRIEEVYDIAYGGRILGVTKRWRFGEVALLPREMLGLDPRHWFFDHGLSRPGRSTKRSSRHRPGPGAAGCTCQIRLGRSVEP